MNRYRKVEVRTYGDERFRKLSRIPPCGQGLWLYLITGPHTTAIPGLFRAGRAGIAEELGWPLEDFDQAFEEVSAQGMAKADFKNRVIWIRKALKHNSPASPNVVTSWAAELDLIPECSLKCEAISGIHDFLITLHPTFLRAFDAILSPGKSSRIPLSKSLPKPSRKSPLEAMGNQEQQQEQEQEQEKTKRGARTTNEVPAGGSPLVIKLPLNDGSEYPVDENQLTNWKELYPSVDVRQELRKYKGWADAHPAKRKTRRGILGSVNSWLAKEQDKSAGTGEVNGANRKFSIATAKQERSCAAIQKAARNL
jgi:hypothetical protein